MILTIGDCSDTELDATITIVGCCGGARGPETRLSAPWKDQMA